MISINLLRHPLAKERGMRQRYKRDAGVVLSIFFASTVVCGLVWADLDRSLVQLHIQKDQLIAQVVESQHRSDQFEMMQREIAALKKRSQEVMTLVAQQRQPLQLLDVVSRSLNPLDIWLANLEMEQEKVTLTGVAKSRNQIVQFAQNLKRHELFQDVAVLETGKISGEYSVYPFTMNLLLVAELYNVTPS